MIPCDKVPTYSSDRMDVTEGNNVEIRIACVDELLRRGKLVVSDCDECRMILDGFNGKYCYRKMRATSDGAERYDDKPDKNDWSHIMDAVQYLCLGATRGAADYSRPLAASEDMIQNISAASFSVDFDCV